MVNKENKKKVIIIIEKCKSHIDVLQQLKQEIGNARGQSRQEERESFMSVMSIEDAIGTIDTAIDSLLDLL